MLRIFQNGEHKPDGAVASGWWCTHGVWSGGNVVLLQPLLAHADGSATRHADLWIKPEKMIAKFPLILLDFSFPFLSWVTLKSVNSDYFAYLHCLYFADWRPDTNAVMTWKSWSAGIFLISSMPRVSYENMWCHFPQWNTISHIILNGMSFFIQKHVKKTSTVLWLAHTRVFFSSQHVLPH